MTLDVAEILGLGQVEAELLFDGGGEGFGGVNGVEFRQQVRGGDTGDDGLQKPTTGRGQVLVGKGLREWQKVRLAAGDGLC